MESSDEYNKRTNNQTPTIELDLHVVVRIVVTAVMPIVAVERVAVARTDLSILKCGVMELDTEQR